MSGIALWVGLAVWMLLAAGGLVIRERPETASEVAVVVSLLSWTAGMLLVWSAVEAWRGGWPVPPDLPPVLLVAAVAAPQAGRAGFSPRKRALLLLPALVPAVVGLLRLPFAPDEAAGAEATFFTITLAFCGGLGARAVGESLAAWESPPGSISPLAYLCLTFLTGGVLLTDLLRSGTWTGSFNERGLAAAWLVGSGARLVARKRPWWWALLNGLAGIIMVGVAVWDAVP